jgi:hypothetical protein
MAALDIDTYVDLIERCERHYATQGFVKWTDLATELGVSRQLILQKLQRAVCHGLVTPPTSTASAQQRRAPGWAAPTRTFVVRTTASASN